MATEGLGPGFCSVGVFGRGDQRITAWRILVDFLSLWKRHKLHYNGVDSVAFLLGGSSLLIVILLPSVRGGEAAPYICIGSASRAVYCNVVSTRVDPSNVRDP